MPNMESRLQTQQESGVDPLWDSQTAVPGVRFVRRESQSSEEVTSKKSTPLTPQEFELLSNSNPFKQDIAEKYGLAYPGITTRAHAREVVNVTSGRPADTTDPGDIFDSTGGEADRDVRRSSKDGQSVFTALSQFLLRNRQSIDETIKKLDESDDFLSDVQKNSMDLLEDGKTNEAIDNTVWKKDTEMFVSRQNQSTGELSPRTCKLSQIAAQMEHFSVEELFDPFLAKKNEDLFRKRDHTKAFSLGDRFAHSKDDSLDIQRLSTRSFEVSELSDPGTKRFGTVIVKKRNLDDDDEERESDDMDNPNHLESDVSVAKGDDKNEASIPDNFGLISLDPKLSCAGEKSTVMNFDDSFSEYLLKTSKVVNTIGKLESGFALHSSGPESHQNEMSPKSPEDTEKVKKEKLYSSQASLFSIGLDSAHKTVRVQGTEKGDIEFVQSSITSPHREVATAGISRSQSPRETSTLSPGVFFQATLPVDMSDKQSRKSDKDLFSSSFYTVFSTTISSLEDSGEEEQGLNGNNQTEKTAGNIENQEVEKIQVEEIELISPESEHVVEARSFVVKDEDVWEVLTSSDVEGMHAESTQVYQCDQNLPCISKDILLQKKFKVSDDSAESSHGSVSRESMKVNLSEDSSTLDQLEDLPGPMSGTQVMVDTISHRRLDLLAEAGPLSECTSTDSVFVHVSNDNLQSTNPLRSGMTTRSLKRSGRTCTDKERGEVAKEGRRQSLPVMPATNLELDPSLILTHSQSTDVDDVLAEEQQQEESEIVDVQFTSALDVKDIEEPSVQEHISPITFIIENQPTSQYVSSVPTTALDKGASRISGRALPLTHPAQEEGNDDKESPTHTAAFTEFIRSRLQKPLRAIAMFSPRTHDKNDKSAHLHELFSETPLHHQHKTAPIVTQPGTQPGVVPLGSDHQSTFRDRLLHMRSPKAENPGQLTGHILPETIPGHNVNITIPPDLVPYEDVYTESLQTLREVPSDNALVIGEDQKVYSSVDNANDFEEKDNVDDLKTSVRVSKDQAITDSDRTLETEEPLNDEKDEKLACRMLELGQEKRVPDALEEVSETLAERAGSVESSSDSDGGDIDSIVKELTLADSESDDGDIDKIVKEFKQESSESDDGDIDSIVKEYKKDNPDQESDDLKLRSSAFNKLGRVLNKMQSVTKYMTKRKSIDLSGQEDKPRPSGLSLSGKQSRSCSRDESPADPHFRAKSETGDKSEEFDILSKAAEVFKEQTIKKKIVSPGKVWRSRTLQAENVPFDDTSDYDLVTKAAVLFRGFKGKKADDGVKTAEKLEAKQSPKLPEESKTIGSRQGDGKDEQDKSQFPSMQTAESSHDHAEVAVRGDAPPSTQCEHMVPGDGSGTGPTGVSESWDSQPMCTTLIKSPDQNDVDIDTGMLHDSEFDSTMKPGDDLNVTPAAATPELLQYHPVVQVDSHSEMLQFDSDNTYLSGLNPDDTRVSCQQVFNTLLTDQNTFVQPVLLERVNILEAVIKTEEESKDIKEPASLISFEVKEEQSENKVQNQKYQSDDAMVVETKVSPEALVSPSQTSSPQTPRVMNENTCDLILSTGYEELKVTRRIITTDSPKLKDDNEENFSDAILTDENIKKTSEKLTVSLSEESACLGAGTEKPPVDTLDIRPPEYQRLSSESSEGPDSHSLTVNFPESLDNMKSLEEDGSSSLCCGGNFKLNLNCAAVVKKPDRRPSAVIIEDKRCAMTEEEKMFPLNVTLRECPASNEEVTEAKEAPEQKTEAEKLTILRVHNLKVNEHELNRNFAGSREELLETTTTLKQSEPQDVKEVAIAPRQEVPISAKAAEDVHNFDDINRRQKQNPEMLGRVSSSNADVVAEREASSIYESVLHELIQKQLRVHPVSDTLTPVADMRAMDKEKRFGRVISESELDNNFVDPTQEVSQNIEGSQPATEQTAYLGKDTIVESKPSIDVIPSRNTAAPLLPVKNPMQQSLDVYDNVIFSDSPPPIPERAHRRGQRHPSDQRYHTAPRSSFTSVVSEGAADVYSAVRRPHGRTKWVSSTPHLSATDRPEAAPSNRTSSYPYLPGSESDMRMPYPGPQNVSANSVQSDSVCWGNYARIDDLHDRKSNDSESSSGLVIPGVGRESTLSDVSDSYFAGEYSNTADDPNSSKVLRPLNGHHSDRHNAFQFKHFPAALDESHYQNFSVITSQPTSSHYRMASSQPNVYQDRGHEFEHYTFTGQPMLSKGVQFSAPTSPIGVIKVHCASQTSSESLSGLVGNDASDILEGLPVFEYTLGATQSTHSLQSDLTDLSPVTRYSDQVQPDLTRQTASLDRRKFRHAGHPERSSSRKKATKVTFSRDQVLTEVMDGIKKSEQTEAGSGPRSRGGPVSSWSSFGGGVRGLARIFQVPFQCCRSGRSGKAKPTEPPLLRHSFRLYHFRRPHRCFVCKQLVYNQGSACQVCRYICHRKCELQVMSTCVPQVTNELSNEPLNRNQSSSRSVGLSSQTPSPMSSTVRDMLNKSQEHSTDGRLALDVVYITERIISTTFPSDSQDNAYSLSLKEVVNMLKTKHGDNYLVINLSEKRADLVKANNEVKEFGWPDHLAPPLERLCSLCKVIDSWLNADVRNVVVLHCKGGRSRIACIIAAYMHYSNICASPDQALDRLAMKRYYEEKLGGLSLPSQRRYVRYFSGLLSGAIKINSNPLYLHHILIHGVPNFDTKGGCRPFIKVYQSMQPIFTSGVYNVTDNMQKVCISISPGIPLRGDILIKCYHKKNVSGQREVMWQCQFHTCAISDTSLVFSKHELDDAVSDPRFPDNGKVEFVFGPSSDVLVSVSGFKSDVTVPVDDNEETLARSDSYENFNRLIENSEGYAGHSSSYNKQFTSNAVTINNNIINHKLTTNNNLSSEALSPSYTHPVAHQPSAPSRRVTQTAAERTQLDDLLSDLLSEQAYVSPTQHRPQRSFQTAVQSQQTPASPPEPSMNAAKSYSTSSRTFSSYSSSDRAPDKLLIQRAEVSYKLPGQGEVKDHYTIAADPNDVLDTGPSRSGQEHPAHHPKGVPTNAFSYTAGLSSSTSSQQSTSQRAEVIEHEVIRSPPARSLQSPPSSRPPYPTEFESRFEPQSSTYTHPPPEEGTSAWLTQQQQKLKNFKEGRDSTGRTEQEKKLVNELRFAQNKYYTKKDHEEQDHRVHVDSLSRRIIQNGPTSPEKQASSSYFAPQKSHLTSSAPVDALWPQDQLLNTSYSTSSYSESRTYGDKWANKPPPSPTMQRSQPAPAPVPARTSSKDYMRTRSNSSSSWQQPPPPAQHTQRTLVRQQSDTLFDRQQREVEPIQPKSYGSTQSTPPLSPRAISPSGGHSTTTYTTYRTIDRLRDAQRAQHAPPPIQQPPPPIQQPPTQINHHYITEVFVHRTDLNKDKTDSQTRLDELGKNLEAASHSIRSQQQQQHIVRQVPQLHQQQQQKQVFEESMQTHSSRQYQTFQETKPEPLRVKEIEEDRIMLRPIGPGVQTLEPESAAHVGTLTRPTTPGFPLGPATPPFPVSPRTPYQNTVGESQFISPTGTLQHPIQQQQHQTVQYQQYQSQHHQTQSAHQNGGQGQGTLHIDTSPKMFVPPHSPPSAGSPPSPGNFNTLRQQLSSAHAMSSSVLSPGPHSMTGQSSPSVYFGLSRRGSLSSLTDTDMVHTTPKFVKDMSKYWYKPNISREEAIQMLKDKLPGTFVIRDSNSFPGAFGLALKVATIPANVHAKPSGDPQADLVRHFLIEPTPKGVRLRGCSNEPVFGSLAALVYQHSITPLALPCKLVLPEADVDGVITPESPGNVTELNSAAALLAQGAACNVIFINSVDMESLTGPQAVAKAVKSTFENPVQGRTTAVHFKVSNQGITLTDNNRKLFFRRHYPVTAVTYCGMDPQDRRWKRETDAPGAQGDARIFGFVARKQGSSNENTCHIFAELDPEQPASAIVNFVTKVMIGQGKGKS